jgi:hypothetical protein
MISGYADWHTMNISGLAITRQLADFIKKLAVHTYEYRLEKSIAYEMYIYIFRAVV